MESKQRLKPRREKLPKSDIQASRFAFEHLKNYDEGFRYMCAQIIVLVGIPKCSHCPFSISPTAILPAVRLWALGDHNDLSLRCYRGPAPLFILRARHIPGYRLSLTLCGPWDDICAAREMRGQEDEYHNCIQLSST